MKFNTILVAVDFSDDSDVAVKAAQELALQYGATLHVVHAFELVTPLVSPYQVAVPDLYLVESRNVATNRLKEVVARVAAKGISVKSHLTEAPAAPAIARIAKEIGADLIVIGTRGMTGLKHFVLGSVAERTLRLAPCSVLTIKAREE